MCKQFQELVRSIALIVRRNIQQRPKGSFTDCFTFAKWCNILKKPSHQGCSKLSLQALSPVPNCSLSIERGSKIMFLQFVWFVFLTRRKSCNSMDYHVLLTFGLVMSLSLICHARSPENRKKSILRKSFFLEFQSGHGNKPHFAPSSTCSMI